jgi:hypothetical protein
MAHFCRENLTNGRADTKVGAKSEDVSLQSRGDNTGGINNSSIGELGVSGEQTDTTSDVIGPLLPETDVALKDK